MFQSIPSPSLISVTRIKGVDLFATVFFLLPFSKAGNQREKYIHSLVLITLALMYFPAVRVAVLSEGRPQRADKSVCFKLFALYIFALST